MEDWTLEIITSYDKKTLQVTRVRYVLTEGRRGSDDIPTIIPSWRWWHREWCIMKNGSCLLYNSACNPDKTFADITDLDPP